VVYCVCGKTAAAFHWSWKAHGRLPICDNWTFFANFYGSDFIKKILFEVGIKGGGLSLNANFRWNGTSPTNFCLYQKTRVITLSCGIEILAVCSFVSSQSTHVMDGQTDDPQDRASVAAARSKNMAAFWSSIQIESNRRSATNTNIAA